MAECAVKAPINANKKRARIRQNKIGYLARKNTVCGMTSSWGEDDILWIFFRRLMKKSKTGSAGKNEFFQNSQVIHRLFTGYQQGKPLHHRHKRISCEYKRLSSTTFMYFLRNRR